MPTTMQFEATAISSRFPRGRKPGTLEIINGNLCFITSDEEVLGMPVKNVKISQGGAGNRYIYFTHESFPDLTFYTDDKAILNLPDIRHDLDLKPTRARIRNNRTGLWIGVWLILGLIVTGILSLYIFRGKIVEHVASLLTPEKEQELASSMLESAIAGKKIVRDTAIKNQLALITDPLVNAVDDKRFKFSFTIIEDPTLNAYALPGGAVVIHSGLIEKAHSPEELAGVLAHEISHVTRRHHIRGVIGKMGMFMIVRGFLGDITGVSSELATAGATLGSLKYSRDYEREADNSGWDLLVKAHIDPHGMIDFFETMKKEAGGAEVSYFISTHPGTSERIEVLKQKNIPKENYIHFNMDFEAFKKSIQDNLKK